MAGDRKEDNRPTNVAPNLPEDDDAPGHIVREEAHPYSRLTTEELHRRAGEVGIENHGSMTREEIIRAMLDSPTKRPV